MIEELKSYNIRIPKDMWLFLKYNSLEKEESMNSIINKLLIKYKKRIENKLTNE